MHDSNSVDIYVKMADQLKSLNLVRKFFLDIGFASKPCQNEVVNKSAAAWEFTKNLWGKSIKNGNLKVDDLSSSSGIFGLFYSISTTMGY